MVARAKQAVRHPNVEFICTDGAGLPDLGEPGLQLVYSFLVFQHLPRPQFQRYLQEAHANLVPGGHLVFQIKVDDTSSHPEPPAMHPYGLRYYTRDEVARLLSAAGFDGIRRVGFGGGTDNPSGPAEDVVFSATKVAQ
jgi:SAM-dependent methyltransferase